MNKNKNKVLVWCHAICARTSRTTHKEHAAARPYPCKCVCICIWLWICGRLWTNAHTNRWINAAKASKLNENLMKCNKCGTLNSSNPIPYIIHKYVNMLEALCVSKYFAITYLEIFQANSSHVCVARICVTTLHAPYSMFFSSKCAMDQ